MLTLRPFHNVVSNKVTVPFLRNFFGGGGRGWQPKHFSWTQGEFWTSTFARSPNEGCFNDFKLTLTSDKPDES